ncbi:potassium transporter [Pholiota molesta]|nr:potassium transporter [Pholiota molesta]
MDSEETVEGFQNVEKDKDRRRQHSRRHRSGNSSSIQKSFASALNWVVTHSTFFRVHVAAFTFIPLIFSGIFFASNGRFHIGFVDSMFLCYSAMTVTGLSTINLSTLTTFQQFILYFLMMIGDFTIASWIMVLIRKEFFKNHCEGVVAKARKKPRSLRSKASFMETISAPIAAFKQREPTPRQGNLANTLSNPQIQFVGPTPGTTLMHPTNTEPPKDSELQSNEERNRILPDSQLFSSSPKSANEAILSPDVEPSFRSPLSNRTARSTQIGFALSTTISPRVAYYHPMLQMQGQSTMVVPSNSPLESKDASSSTTLQEAAPSMHRKMERTMTMSTYTTLHSTNVRWLNFSGLVVGRNSDFHTESLTDEQLEDIGGAEYRALRLLSYLYFVLCQLFTVLLFLPWLSVIHTYDGVFAAHSDWFAFFQAMGAYTGGGLSLVDLGMVPFQNAYLMIAALIFVILAGNHALLAPCHVRLVLFKALEPPLTSRVLPEHSESQEALSFLLDHPRSFPSHQTWFLVVCLALFSIIEWVAFLVLNIGLPAYDSIPVGPRVLSGLFQGLAARASGFAIVPVANLAPALQFLYVVMMYIAIAISIRSTNVYEERSLGVFAAPPDDEDEEPEGLDKIKSRRERVGRYLGWHLRRQLSIDIWWLVWAVFFIAIIERGNLLDDSKKWFDLFRVLFELVSAFGGIGLSLGLPYDNFAFSGALHPLSKIIVIIIMVRGRHRGLPVAVDRAVLLPSDLVTQNHESDSKPQEKSGDSVENAQLSAPAPV